MKIKANILSKFMDKVSLNGTLQEIGLRFEKDGLYVETTDPGQYGMVKGFLKSSTFTEYNELKEIAINDFNTFIKIIKMFKDEIEIVKTENMLLFKDKAKEIEVPLMDWDLLNQTLLKKLPVLSFKNIFTLNSNVIKDFGKDIGINETKVIKFIMEPKKLILESAGKYKIKSSYIVNEIVDSGQSIYGEFLFNYIDKFDGDLTIKLGAIQNDDVNWNAPIIVQEISDYSNITIMVAPRME